MGKIKEGEHIQVLGCLVALEAFCSKGAFNGLEA